jgi:dTDP-4-dehydrorhamnose reductase
MRILILGGDGMLGHQLFKHLKRSQDVCVTLHQSLAFYSNLGLFNASNAYVGVDLQSLNSLVKVLADFHPQVIINAAGIIKQRLTPGDTISYLEINSLFPHRLAALCKAISARLILLSTDCVFSGRKGNYTEADYPDAEDLYGRSKLLGEVNDDHCLTLRTSMIGKELYRKKSLLEWFLAQKGPVEGYKNAIFTGFTTLELSRIIEMMITNHPIASGIYHVSSDPISKFDLLSLIKEKLQLQTVIIPNETYYCNRSLDSSRFRRQFCYTPSSWEVMIQELSKELRGE